MKTVDKFLMGSLVLVALYMMLKSSKTDEVIGSVAGGYSSIIKALQGGAAPLS